MSNHQQAESCRKQAGKLINRDAEFMHHIPALINTIADGDAKKATEWKIRVSLRRMSGESLELVYRLLSRAAFPSV